MMSLFSFPLLNNLQIYFDYSSENWRQKFQENNVIQTILMVLENTYGKNRLHFFNTK